ncbi:MAG TPA: hypothetical protein VFP34_16375, partial [Microlunatus sp.]|nr:hypothetical protein [Microlunatus sp.]
MTSAPTDLDGTPRSPYASSAAPGSPRAAWALAIGCWILAAAALVLFFSSYAPGSTFAEDWPFVFTDATMAGVYGTVAAVVLARRRHVVAVFLIVAAVGGGLAAFGAGWRQAVLVGRLPAAPAIEVLYGSAWVPGTLSLFLVVPWLVRERVTPRAWLGAAAGLVVVVAFIMLPALVPDPGAAVAGLTAVAIAGGLATAAGVEHRRRGSGPGEREGLGWLAFGTAMMALSFLPLLLPYGVLPMWIVPALHLACQSVFPAAILVVVLRQRLWGLELAVSRATVAATLAVLLLGLY